LSKNPKSRRIRRKNMKFTRKDKYNSAFQPYNQIIGMSGKSIQYFSSNKKISEKILFQAPVHQDVSIQKSTTAGNLRRLRVAQDHNNAWDQFNDDCCDEIPQENSTVSANNIRLFESRFNFKEK